MSNTTVRSVTARQIFSAREFPAVEATVTTENGSVGVVQCVAGVSIGTHEVAFTYDGGTNMLTNIRYMQNGNLAAVGDSATVLLDKNGKERRRFDYQGTLETFCIDDEDVFAFAVQDSQGMGSHVKMFSAGGQTLGVYSTFYPVISLAVRGRFVAVGEARSVQLIYQNGVMVAQNELPRDIKQVFFMKSKRQLALVSGDAVRQYILK